MFSLVKYTNNEKSIVPTKRIKIIEGTHIIVKCKGGANYEAELIKTSDSKDVLNYILNKSSANTTSSSSDSGDESLQSSSVNKRILSSTVINERIEHELNLEFSQVAAYLENPDSSVPSGYSEIFEEIGDDWLEDSSKFTEPSQQPLASTYNISESRNSVTVSSSKDVDDNSIRKICSTKNKQVLANNTDNSDDAYDHSANFHNLTPVIATTEASSAAVEPSTQDSSQDPDYQTSKSTNIEDASASNISQSVVSSEKSSIFDDSPAVDLRQLMVPLSKNLLKRTTKKHFCLFCHTLQCKIARHLTLKHKDQDEVKNFLNYPKGSSKRKSIIDKLRKQGDFIHNVKPEFNTGILISLRQRQAKYNNTAEDYICCQNCRGFFSKKTIRLHIYKCNSTSQKETRSNTIAGRRIAGYIHKKADPILRRVVFPVLNDDDVSRSIKYDELIILYGNKLCQKYTLEHQHDMIRAQLRLLGRFKLAIKSINSEIDEFYSVFKPQNFDASVSALRIVAHWDTNLMWFKTPAVAQNLTTLIKKIANKYRTECIKNQNETGKKNVCDFLLLWEEEIPVLINKKAAEDQSLQKRQKKVVLPSKSDIKVLFDYLNDQANIAYGLLKNKFNHGAWDLLNSATLILLQIFNRRRAGELERLQIVDFNNRLHLDENVNPDLYANLSADTIAYAKQYVRLTLRGKLGREVSILLTPNNEEFINTLLKYRQNAGVKKTNQYVFAVPGARPLRKQYIRACPLMRKFANECGALIPSSLRGTTLRKHIATFTAMLEVEGQQVERLANFMGHDKEIHRSIYRVPVPVAEMTDVSRLLVAAMGGDEDEENIESEEENSDSSEEENENSENNESSGLTNYSTSNLNDSSVTESVNLTECRTEQKKRTKEMYNFTNSSTEVKRRSTSPYGRTKRTKWSDSEKRAVTNFFGNILKLEKLPSLNQCQEAIRKHKVLCQRQPQQLKSFIDNQRKMQSRHEKYAQKKTNRS